MQTEKAKSSHFDRTRGDKNQIFPTLVTILNVLKITIFRSWTTRKPSPPQDVAHLGVR